jgi:hypothetical protein
MRTCLLTIAALAQPTIALAQTTVPVTASWQISLDNGATWQSGTVQAPQTQASVRVRQFVSWGTPSSADYINGAGFDGIVRSINGAGLGDTTSNFFGILDGMYIPMPAIIQGRRWAPDLIKIDRGDALAPGLGTFVSITNNTPTGGIIYGNPIRTFEYTLNLDGTLGSREFSAAWQQFPVGQPLLLVTVDGLPQPYTYSYTFNDATLVVVPSPAGLALVGVASGVLLRRRRS